VQTCPYYGRLPWKEAEVGGDHLGAKHGSEKGMWVDAAAHGASKERKVGAHGDAQRRSERALVVENGRVV
jgi:hypothetical protein